MTEEKAAPRTTLRAAKPTKTTNTPDIKANNNSKKPAVPLDERLQKTTEAMLATYSVWIKKKESAETENLQEAMHELRRVLAGIEISIATSDKDNNQSPLPQPRHRSKPRSK